MTKRQFLIRFGMNFRAFDTLVSEGVVKVQVRSNRGSGAGITVLSHSLVEGEHFVLCECCGAHLTEISTNHVRSCGGLNLEEYKEKYPNSRLRSNLSVSRRRKTESQKVKQSNTLKERFQSDLGLVTKQQISEAAKRMQASPYGLRAAEHLRKRNQDPEVRRIISIQSKGRWADPAYRAKMEEIFRLNKDKLVESAERARKHITKKLSKPHRRVKTELERSGLTGFVSEYSIGPYFIDEALVEPKIAVEVDGCYWHGCVKCNLPALPKMATLDRTKTAYLTKRGWKVIRLSECDIRNDLGLCIARVQELVDGTRHSNPQ